MLNETFADPALDVDPRSTMQSKVARSSTKPSRAEAEGAVRTLLLWAGDDPDREGLLGTPDRVVRSYEEFFAGYGIDPADLLARPVGEAGGCGGRVWVA